MALITFGDSLTVGSGVSASDCYANKLAASMAIGRTNHAVSGAQAADQSFAATGFNPSSSNLHTVLIGANDVRLYGPAKLAMYERFLRNLVLDLALPSRINATASSVTYTGAWSNTQVNSIGKNTTQQGAKATAQVSGTSVYVSFIIQDHASAGGVVSVRIDGATVGTIDSASQGMATQNGLAYAPAAVRFGGLSAGPHTVELEVTSSGKIFYLEFVAGNDQTTRPSVYVGNVLRQNYAGYGTDANVAAYNAAIASLVAALGSDGLQVALVDASALLSPSTDLIDGIHPNVTGHQKIHDAFLTAIQGAPTLTYSQVPVYRRSDGRFFAGDGAERRELDTL